MSRQNIQARNSFFRSNMAKMDLINKKRTQMRNAKSGDILPDPKVVSEGVKTEDHVVQDLEVSEEQSKTKVLLFAKMFTSLMGRNVQSRLIKKWRQRNDIVTFGNYGLAGYWFNNNNGSQRWVVVTAHSNNLAFVKKDI